MQKKILLSIYPKTKQRRDIKEFSEGLFIHRVLDNLFNKKSHFKDFKEIKDSLNIAMDKVYPDYSPKLNYIKLLWKKRLDGFLRKQIEYFKSGYRVIKREYRVQGEIFGFQFEGIIDRVDTNGINTNLIDYKTGDIKKQNRVKNLERLTDFQMSIYYELLKDKYSNLNLSFIELPSGNITPITKLEEKNKILYFHFKLHLQERTKGHYWKAPKRCLAGLFFQLAFLGPFQVNNWAKRRGILNLKVNTWSHLFG